MLQVYPIEPNKRLKEKRRTDDPVESENPSSTHRGSLRKALKVKLLFAEADKRFAEMRSSEDFFNMGLQEVALLTLLPGQPREVDTASPEY